jgi:hypothetical protein
MDVHEEIQRILSARNYFEVLGLSPTQCNNPTSVRLAFQELASPLRPDRCDDPEAGRALEILSQANSVLGNPARRAQYLAKFQARDRAFHHQTDAALPSLTTFLFRFLPALFFIGVFLLLQSGPRISWFFSGPKITRSAVKGILNFEPLKDVETWQRNSAVHRVQYFVPIWWVQSAVHGGMNQIEVGHRLDAVADEMWIEYLDIQCEIEKNVVGKEDKMCRKRDTYAEK